eukprot:gene2343-5312_t
MEVVLGRLKRSCWVHWCLQSGIKDRGIEIKGGRAVELGVWLQWPSYKSLHGSLTTVVVKKDVGMLKSNVAVVVIVLLVEGGEGEAGSGQTISGRQGRWILTLYTLLPTRRLEE